MLTSENVLKTGFSAYAIRVASKEVSPLTKAAGNDDDRAVATIRELLGWNVAGIRLTASEVNDSISTLQKLAAAAASITEKLILMEKLAGDAASGVYSATGKADAQQEFERIATELNQIVQNTTHDDNKLFTAKGENIAIALGDGSKLPIYARDLGFDADGQDLTTNAKGVLAQLQVALLHTTEYSEYLGGQAERLEEAMAAIERDYAEVLGAEPSDYDVKDASEMASSITGKVRDIGSVLSDSQVRVSREVVGRLLKYEYTALYTKEDAA